MNDSSLNLSVFFAVLNLNKPTICCSKEVLWFDPLVTSILTKQCVRRAIFRCNFVLLLYVGTCSSCLRCFHGGLEWLRLERTSGFT